MLSRFIKNSRRRLVGDVSAGLLECLSRMRGDYAELVEAY
jgi:hypothetical protein